MQVLGCEINQARIEGWVRRLVPARQPFVVDDDLVAGRDVDLDQRPGMDDLDTFLLYGKRRLWWLTEDEFSALDAALRARLVRHQAAVGRGEVPSVRSAPAQVREAARAQADGHRFVWWPHLVAPVADEVVLEFVRRGWPDSLPLERVDWARAAKRLPGAQALAGTFAERSGANCFATVMAAAGADVADEWTQVDDFEAWLAARCRPVATARWDDQPGTVLVWREAGHAAHAAVTVGGGLALNKPSQAWYTPRFLWPVARVVARSRFPGGRLERHRLAD
ncbi:hypothetical protein [Aestuariimicrobium ganziense]|uniref:hypothetical protein n=1 Tax=Aestuariimicrobium ganziense TaxID=2773677 RepID=UPI0019411DE7|nr:hypothetical protein [Aestuariimicrobium ganziense]